MTRPDYDYDAAQKRANACGHTCGCDFARRGELCDFGESKAQWAKDERGASETLPILGFCITVLGIVLAMAYPQIWWTLAAIAAVWLLASIPFAVVVGRRIGGRR